MSLSEILSALGGAAALAAAIIVYLGRLGAKTTADALLERYRLSLRQAEQEYKAILQHVENEHKASLKQAEDVHKSSLTLTEEHQKSLLRQTEDEYKSSLKRSEDEHKSSLTRVEEHHKSLLRQAEEDYRSFLKRTEDSHKASLTRVEEQYKSSIAFSGIVDTDLRTRRIPMYAELWEKTAVLPQWPQNKELEYRDLQQLTLSLRDWYYKSGGMYMSEPAQKAFREVQESIASVLAHKQAATVSPTDYKTVRDKCSTLRTRLTDDLLSRREAPTSSAEMTANDTLQPTASNPGSYGL